MLKKLVLGLSIVAIVGIAHAAQPVGKVPGGELLTTVQWWMSVDAEGNITKLVPKGEAFDGLRDKLEVAMKDWHFEPAKVNGHPAASESVLTARVALVPDGNDYQLKLDSVRAGGSVAKTQVPLFPMRVRGTIMRTGTSAIVILKVNYDGNGAPTKATVAKDSPVTNTSYVDAARRAILNWTFEPERVNGHGVPGTMTVSTCFSREETSPADGPVESPCAWGLSGPRQVSHEREVLRSPAFGPPLTVVVSAF